MRLSSAQLAAIREAATEAFGSEVPLWLFGSRTDDSRRGGDIDLLVAPALDDANARLAAKLRFAAALERRIGERKIDIVIASPNDSRPIVTLARQHGIRLQ